MSKSKVLTSVPPVENVGGSFANYQYSLSARNQAAIQVFLRCLPASCRDNPAWKLLHDLTYALGDWTLRPKYETRPSSELAAEVTDWYAGLLGLKDTDWYEWWLGLNDNDDTPLPAG
jgi:hypothetical protein